MGRALAILSALILTVACASSGTAEPSGAALPKCPTGAADAAAFEKAFTKMDVTSGQPGGEEGRVHTASTEVIIDYTAKAAASARVCVRTRDGAARTVKDQTVPIASGDGRISIGTFSGGPYVIDVQIGEAKVRGMPFTVK